MDNWGDPWADNADAAKTPTKPAVTSILPPTFAPAPTLLNGFLDDAGWGNDDDSFGDWSAAPAMPDVAPPAKTSMNESYTPETFEHTSDDVPWAKSEDLHPQTPHDNGDWAAVNLEVFEDEEKDVSEVSDASTTVQATKAVEDPPGDEQLHLQPDDDSSTRASTSPSETSRNGVPAESPRTSYEEEHGATKLHGIPVPEPEVDRSPDTSPAVTGLSRLKSVTNDKDEEDVATDAPLTEKVEDRADTSSEASDTTFDSPKIPKFDADDRPERASVAQTASSHKADTFVIDADLLRDLFPSTEPLKLDEPPHDPIYSTSGRKAWYRLTRRLTMREYNHGTNDDNYIRVTWANSHIKSEVDKIVGRWAREDRISGTGPGARASFYWDTPAPTESQIATLHSWQQSSQAASSVTVPKRESIPPLSVTAPAAFSWSSASAPVDPWQQASPGLCSTSSPIAPIHPSPTDPKQQTGRATSLNIASHKPTHAAGMQTWTATPETPTVASLFSPATASADTTSPASDTWAGLDTFDTASAPKTEDLRAPVDNDDEWGEMVSTPTATAFATATTTTQTDTPDESSSIPETPPRLSKSAVFEDQSPETMHAAPIVRLRSTISPTSALFKANSFIPLGTEQGPIGPGILKSAKRVASVTGTKVDDKPPSSSRLEVAPPVRPVEISRTATSDVFSAWQSSTPEVAVEKQPIKETSSPPAPLEFQEPVRPTTPPAQLTVASEPNVDAWADADFSFFESSLPVPSQPQPEQSALDALSGFEIRSRSTSSASSAKMFSRSPPRKSTSAPIQPLTGATSSAQRRKNEEDSIIQNILSGLPDLSYMLRR